MNLKEIIDKSASENESTELARKILRLVLDENPTMAVAAKALDMAWGTIAYLSSKAPVSECIREAEGKYPYILAQYGEK